MARVTPPILDAMSPDEAFASLTRGFSWLREEADFVRACLAWQATTSPRPAPYFRWHLPRFVLTCQFVARTLRGREDISILDLATYGPYSVLMGRYLVARGITPRWTRTSVEGDDQGGVYEGEPTELPTVACQIGWGPLPFEPETFDVVLLTEVIEHLDTHPQAVLLNIHKVLNPGGTLILTTPNSCSWKKIRLASNGVPEYDSPTFVPASELQPWGHRYEYSSHVLQRLLQASGYAVRAELARDIYFDDPSGLRQFVEFSFLLAGKVVAGHWRSALRLVRRRGSGLFLAAERTAPTPAIRPAEMLPV
jgi:SAM-dependent methyltransferase